jgi:hypothetical protein
MKTYNSDSDKLLLRIIGITVILLIVIAPITYSFAQNAPKKRLKIEQAMICEAVREFQPINPGITFSIANGSIACFTRFDAVPVETFIGHRWYRKDELVTEQKLILKPPQWSTYSRIQLREFDKGPWRVEIVDSDNQVISILRFSVTE